MTDRRRMPDEDTVVVDASCPSLPAQATFGGNLRDERMFVARESLFRKRLQEIHRAFIAEKTG